MKRFKERVSDYWRNIKFSLWFYQSETMLFVMVLIIALFTVVLVGLIR